MTENSAILRTNYLPLLAKKTIQVFISSTFRDMHAKRDHLVRFVFPRLRQTLLPFDIQLIDVDLRWGVTAAQDALAICREIIDECRPYFLCMLGGRYGWVPPGQTSSITAQEVEYAALTPPPIIYTISSTFVILTSRLQFLNLMLLLIVNPQAAVIQKNCMLSNKP